MATNNEISQEITNWRHESVLNLADHFHQLDPTTQQQRRVGAFRMKDTDLGLFKEIIKSRTIRKIKMHLGLAAVAEPYNFTASFFIEVAYNADATKYFPLYPVFKDITPLVKSYETDIVPMIFKEVILKNWNEMNLHQIDDLFTATKDEQLLRVHYFEIGTLMVEYINTVIANCLDDLEGISIYPGADLNKFSNKETISFTPVLGFKMTEAAGAKLMHEGFYNCIRGELFMEYSLPCPPTCYPNG